MSGSAGGGRVQPTLVVILGYTAFLIYTIAAGFAPLKESIDELIREALMITLFTFATFNARDLEPG